MNNRLTRLLILFTPVVLLMFFLPLTLKGQTYEFSVSSEPFEFLENGIQANSGVWDDPDLAIPIGFEFEYFDSVLTHLYLRSEFSFITLTDNPDSLLVAGIVPFGGDLVDRGILSGNSMSPITYKTTGSAGSRVFTLEFENAGFYWDIESSGQSTDFVNFQMRLYEADGSIEFHYGPNNHDNLITDYNGNTGPLVNLIEAFDGFTQTSLGEVLILSGDPSDPDVSTTLADVYLDGSIPEDIVYRFAREPSGVDEIREAYNWYSPNPTTGFLHLNLSNADEIKSVKVFNSGGQLVKVTEQPQTIDMHSFGPGLYDLMIYKVGTVVRQRIALIK